ncbi:probable STR2 - Cystathionine gamma-synthase [Melanopsichium pennsylvanicum]|uniref:cystathionine gamma-synthase n=2 Tax=Melanopsichium pennsylvanicum TaxID=63383 RepID=A0AAJ4XRC2_9BASI|nr:probable STR2 - Cystathionine gamma-synthase [Melanopsichium pennsylvanicum]
MQLASSSIPPPSAPLPSNRAASCKKDYQVGTSIPANMAHAVSVSLPLWSDNIDYEEGRLSNSMETGYPRFFIHRSIQRLATLLRSKFARPEEACILLPTANIAEMCRDFMRSQTNHSHKVLPIRIVRFSMLEHTVPTSAEAASSTSSTSSSTAELQSENYRYHAGKTTTAHYIFIIFFPQDAFPLAKSFWQHTGDGITSRQAERFLSLLEQPGMPAKSIPDSSSFSTTRTSTADAASTPNVDDIYRKPVGGSAGKRFYNRYTRSTNATATSTSTTTSATATPSPTSTAPQTPSSSGILRRPSSAQDDLSASTASLSGVTPANNIHSNSSTIEQQANNLSESGSSDLVTYVEERYGRNLPLSSAPSAKLALRRRIAGTLLSDRSPTTSTEAPADEAVETSRTGTGVTENDVYLYPCGMSAIFHAHQLAMRAAPHLNISSKRGGSEGVRNVGKSVCFGFPYTDTLKILQKFGPGCHFFGLGLDSDLDTFEQHILSQQHSSDRILALFCEFPSNPLLRSPNLTRIRELADRYDFLVCVDETIGNFVNVEVLPFADVLVSSLTKVFSGDANVMGGSMVLNPHGKYYGTLCRVLNGDDGVGGLYEDTFFDEDAIFMERNSRDFIRRIVKIDQNARAITEMLWGQKQSQKEGGKGQGVIKDVFYPKYQTRLNYDTCRRKKGFTSFSDMVDQGGGYGGLFSITFKSEEASRVFYDTLTCAKGPSLGTNLTLASPYTILAHYGELEWAAEFGVERGLVRVSIGLEDEAFLVKMFKTSLEAAEKAHIQFLQQQENNKEEQKV